MSINSTSWLTTTPAGSQSTNASAQSTNGSAQSGSTAQPAAGGGAKSGGGGDGSGSAKTIVSDVSITVNGMTTTTITYSDGTTDVEVTQSAQSSQASPSKTYTAQGTMSSGSGYGATSSSAS